MQPEKRFARGLFDSISPRYELPAEVLSLGQYGRWRRALVDGLPIEPGARILDVATGTGLVARDLERRFGTNVIGLDQSAGMLDESRRRSARPLVGADADSMPFVSDTFDALIFSYLLRYVKDPAATLRELVRIVKPGGVVASQEFGVPTSRFWGAGWRAHSTVVMPAASRVFGAQWRTTGEFLAHNIVAWADGWPVERQVAAWEAAGIREIRVKRPLFGTCVLMQGIKR